MTSAPLTPASGPARRTVMAAAGAAGLAAALTACGGSDDSSGGSSDATGSTGATGSSDAAGTALTKTAEIPEGGGKVFADEKVVVSQPKAGDFKAFSTICTHQRCPMTDLKGDTISCSCHGSQFSITDGSVKKGPATEPLAAQQITVKGDSITLA